MILHHLAKRIFFFSAAIGALAHRADHNDRSNLKTKREARPIERLGIVNGTEANSTRYPYMVAWTSLSGSIMCGGSLIAEDLVLTAAHCQNNMFSMMQIGRHDLFDTNDVHEEYFIGPDSQYPHENYNDATLNNDFMIVKLPSSSTYPRVKIDKDPATPVDKDILHVMGWGTKSSGGVTSDVLMFVDVYYETNEQCAEKYGQGVITDQMMCAADVVEVQDSCQGDSGGPLIMWGDSPTGEDDIQTGVVSWGMGCADSLYPGVYARLTSVQDWINTKVCSLSSNPPSEYDCTGITSQPTTAPNPAPEPGSCANQCGGNAGNCYCDNACITHGDCCDDACSECSVGCLTSEPSPSPTFPPSPSPSPSFSPPTSSCANICGNFPGDCYCDDECVIIGDCCEDACTECGLCAKNKGEKLDQPMLARGRSPFKRSG